MKAFMDNLSKNERNEERQGHTSLQLEEQHTSELQAGPSSWFDIGISPELNANFAWNQNERTTANVKGGAGVDAELVQVGLTEAISNFEQVQSCGTVKQCSRLFSLTIENGRRGRRLAI